jgi:transcriptional regulator
VQPCDIKKGELPVWLRHDNQTGGYYAQVPVLAANNSLFLKRYQIMVFLQTGRSQTKIADTLNCSKSTISRGVRRNSFAGEYDPCDAQVSTIARRKFARKATKKALKYCRLFENGSDLAGPL